MGARRAGDWAVLVVGDPTRKTDDDREVGGVGWRGWVPDLWVRFVSPAGLFSVASLGTLGLDSLGRFGSYLICAFFLGR